MDEPSISNPPNTAPVGNSFHPQPIAHKNNLLLVLIAAILSGIIFGVSGYYLGKMTTPAPVLYVSPTLKPSPYPTPSPQNVLVPSPATNKIVEFFDLPPNWVTTPNGAQTVKSCYGISTQKIGVINKPFMQYLVDQNYGQGIEEIVRTTKQYVWQGIESYTLPSFGIGEVNTIYVRPGEDQWFKININYTGAGEGTANPPEFSCEQEKNELETVVRNVRFL